MSALRLAYVPCSSEEEALRIARTLVEKRVVACGNVGAPMRSVFRWEGNVDEAKEVPLLLKTTEDHVTAVTALIQSLHSYDTPCVLWFPDVTANDDYAAWVRASVR